MPQSCGLFYSDYHGGLPNATPVVLIHGGFTDHRCWPAQVRRLPNRRVVAVDLPGHGRSEGFCAHTVDAYPRSILRLLDDLQIYNAVFIGHALGAAVAVALLEFHPERVAGLGLVSLGMRFNYPDGAETLLNQEPESLVRDLLQRAGGQDQDSGVTRKVALEWRSNRPGLLAADLRAGREYGRRNKKLAAEVPTWICVGEEDGITPAVSARVLQAGMPQSSLRVVPGAGHLLPWQHPETLCQGVSGFVKCFR